MKVGRRIKTLGGAKEERLGNRGTPHEERGRRDLVAEECLMRSEGGETG